jgi:CheY-like chemotaxis protein
MMGTSLMTGDQKQILLIEAEPVLAEVTAFRLELLGYSVTTVGSAEDALLAVERNIPNLILTNLELPGLDALSLIEQLASDENTSEIPIIVLSMDADLDQVQTVYTAGAKDFLVVPFHPEVLEEKVARHVTGETTHTDDNSTLVESNA